MRKLTLLVVVLAVALRLPSAGGQTRVEVDLYTDCNFGQSDCPRQELHHCLSGSVAYLHIGILNLPAGTDTSTDNLVDWPHGLIVRAGTYTDGNWVEIPGLVETLSLRRWTFALLREKLRNQPDSAERGWVFKFILPQDRAGRTLFFQAEYTLPNGEVYSSPLTASRGRVVLTAVEPCSDADRNRVAASFVRSARSEGDFVRAMTIADSLIGLGWYDPDGLTSAAGAAKATGEWDKRLQYLELLNKQPQQR